MSPIELTTAVENYLKTIYELSQASGLAATTEIATKLGVAPASVTAMAKRLTQNGLVSHELYRGLKLTPAGRTVALQLVRRHRVIEAYLVARLGYTWDQVHDEAERLEHSTSDELVNRMAAAIGEPTVDPHGAPIPTAQGEVDEKRYRSLRELAAGAEARIVCVEDEDPELLRYLAARRFVLGATVCCVKREPFEGPLTIRVGSETHLIGPPLAARIFVDGD